MTLLHITHRMDDCVEALSKLAEGGESEMSRKLRLAGKSMLSFGAGTVAGLGLGVGANALHKHMTGRSLPPAAVQIALPLLGAASGMAYSTYKALEAEAMKNVSETSQHPGHGAPRRGE